MRFQDLSFLPRGGFATTFLYDCGRGEGFRTTTCLKTVVGISNGMFPVKYFCSTKPLFESVEFDVDHKTA